MVTNVGSGLWIQPYMTMDGYEWDAGMRLGRHCPTGPLLALGRHCPTGPLLALGWHCPTGPLRCQQRRLQLLRVGRVTTRDAASCWAWAVKLPQYEHALFTMLAGGRAMARVMPCYPNPN